MRGPTVVIYTDGACKPNPGQGGWAAVLRHDSEEQVLTGSELHTTNNRMELTAAIAALEALGRPSRVELHTDSRYLQQGITKWLPNWLARGWRGAGRKPILNADLWTRLYSLIQKHDVHWHWVRAHGEDPENVRVDALAYQAIPTPGNSPPRSGQLEKDK